MVKNTEGHSCKLFPYLRQDVLSLQEASQKSGWSITAFNLPECWKYTRGKGVVVAVLDSGCDLDHPDLINNLLPGINLINRGKPPIDDCSHGCVHPNTLIHTDYCGIKTIKSLYNSLVTSEVYTNAAWIKDVRELNIKTYALNYLTGESVIDQIEYIHRIPIRDKIISVTLEGNINIELTSWHPIYIKQITAGGRSKTSKKKAIDLCVGDQFIYPQGNLAGKLSDAYQIVSGKQRKQCKNCGHILRTFSNNDKKCKKCKRIDWKLFHNKYTIDSDLSYLVGIVLTDGYVNISGRRVEVSSATPEILDKILMIAKKYNFSAKINYPKNGCGRVLIYSTELITMLTNLGILYKSKSYNQRLPEFVAKSPFDVICSFLSGIIDGDGCISKTNTRNRITSASKSFVVELSCLFNSIGISSGVQEQKNHLYSTQRRYNKKHSKNPIFQCCFSAIPTEISKFLAHPRKRERSNIVPKFTHKGRRVKSIKIKNFDGDFYDFTVEKNHTYIANGHFVSNTHATGIICAENNDIGIVGVAPEAKVIPVKVLDKNGNGTLEIVAEGIRWATDQNVDMLSMSLGSPYPIQQVRKAIQYAEKKGIPVFCAAGNAGNTKDVFYPGAYSETIAIGSIDENFCRADYSNTGPNLDFMAPGSKILSTVPPHWYAIMTGTSMACPWAVGVAALFLSYSRTHNLGLPLKTVEDYRNVFRQYTIDIKDIDLNNKLFYEGFGIIDPRKFHKALSELAHH
jgi:subtilisin family serine protease